jgi:hypothetical protein
MVKRLEFVDYEADGDYDVQNVYTLTYNKVGDLIKEVRDDGNDGIID